MEFQKFWEERKRMCISMKNCKICPMNKEAAKYMSLFLTVNLCDKFVCDYCEDAENVVEKWAAENPPMTNGKKFCEVFGINLIAVPVYSHNDPRVVLNIDNIPLEEWLQAEYKEPKEAKT